MNGGLSRVGAALIVCRLTLCVMRLFAGFLL